MTETEPEYDLNERDNWWALREYDDSLCPQCGQLRSLCESAETVFNPQISACYRSLAQTMYSRKWHDRFKDTKPDEDGWHPTDGAIVWASEDLPPDATYPMD